MNKKTIIAITLLILISGCTQLQDSSQLETSKNQIKILEEQNQLLDEKQNKTQLDFDEYKERNIQFITKYSIALINMHVAREDIGLAVLNLDLGRYYTETDYFYEVARTYYETGIQQNTKARGFLLRAKKELQDIQNNTPNNFFRKDVQNRIRHSNALLEYQGHLAKMLEYTNEELYQTNFGSEDKAAENLKKYNQEIVPYNAVLEKITEIETGIELEWSQEWYP